MKKKSAMWLLCLAALSCAACDQVDQAVQAVSGDSAKPKVNMVGTWICRDGPILTCYTLRDDGTCTKAVSLPSSFPKQDDVNGTWSLGDDSHLNLHLDYDEIFAVHASDTSVTFENVQMKMMFTKK